MHRSHWGQKSAQQRILCVRLSRFGWEKALSLACATSFFPGLFASPGDWSRKFATAKVHVQWDPERTLRGASLPYYSIQVGLSRHIIQEFVDEWVTSIEDITSRVRKIYNLLQTGEANRAMHFLPQEKIYPVSADLAKRLHMEPSL